MVDLKKDTELQQLLAEKKEICDKINDHLINKYQKYQNMSEEVVNDNPYR